MVLSPELLEILVCPKCRATLTLTEDQDGLICGGTCAVVYPVREEIPVMLIEEAVPLEAWKAGQRKVEKKSND